MIGRVGGNKVDHWWLAASLGKLISLDVVRLKIETITIAQAACTGPFHTCSAIRDQPSPPMQHVC